jgi:phosphoserine aminotransferase
MRPCGRRSKDKTTPEPGNKLTPGPENNMKEKHMPERIYNFSPGPSTLPYPVLQQAAKDIVNFNDKGIGLIELSHRSREFMAVAEETEALIRENLGVPDNYRVLFLQGGASSQFFMVPMNLLGPGKKATYLNTGTWSNKAIKEAKLFGDIDVAFSSEEEKFNRVPAQDEYTVDPASEYLYFVSNNTIYGTQFHSFPETAATLVSDMSSDIFSRRIDVSRFGIIFAGAQKNMGPAGVTVVIIRDDLLDRVPDNVPTMLRYSTHADKGSMFNTPPCFGIYCVGEVMKWLRDMGGLDAMEKLNTRKAGMVYEAIDGTDFYRGHAEIRSRSTMNISFNLPSPELEAKFIAQATAAGLDGLKGHRSIGGCRASIYNAFPIEGVEKLVEFMERFAWENG